MGGAAEFARVYEDVYIHKLAHCALCFRNEGEAALTEPLMFRKAMRALNYNVPGNKYQLCLAIDNVCFMCEARAAAVVRFLDNVQLAIQLSFLLRKASFEQEAKRAKQFQQSLCQNNLRRLRKQTQLTLTEILYVNAGGKLDPRGADVNKTSEVGLTMSLSNTEKRTAPLDMKKSIKRAAKDYPRDKPSTPAKKEDKHPQMRIPTPMLSSNDNIASVTVGQDGFLHVTTTDSKVTEASKKKRVRLHTNCGSSKKPKVNDTNFNIIIENPPSRSTWSKDVVLIVDDDTRTEQVSKEVVKLPVRNNSSVDWEDKIPMEVILFGDSKELAADPAPAPANGQPHLVLSAPYEYRIPLDAPR